MDIVNQGLQQYNDVLTGSLGVCYHCASYIDAADIDSEHELDDAIICSKCGIDAVMPKTILVTLTPEIIEMMNYYGFHYSEKEISQSEVTNEELKDLPNDQ